MTFLHVLLVKSGVELITKAISKRMDKSEKKGEQMSENKEVQKVEQAPTQAGVTKDAVILAVAKAGFDFFKNRAVEGSTIRAIALVGCYLIAKEAPPEIQATIVDALIYGIGALAVLIPNSVKKNSQ